MFDIAIIGAGISGLVCAQQLTQAGYKVVVVEKSRGLGGRVATRRLHNTLADHGASYLEPNGVLQQLVQVLSDRHLLQVWTDTVYEWSPQQQLQSSIPTPRYVAPTGMSAIAKFFATGLEVRLNQRVQAITLTADKYWQLSFEPTRDVTPPLTSQAVVIAIPAPQALMLLSTTDLDTEFLERLRLQEFDPCLSVIAGYSTELQQPAWKAVNLAHPDLSWIGLDSSKRMATEQPVFVLHSSAEFAQRYLEAEDLQPAGDHLLAQAAALLPGLETPEWMQVHRWRYAFPRRPWHDSCLSADSLPLVCCGDWCGTSSNLRNRVENAMVSGLAAATKINSQLQQRSLPGINFIDLLN